MSNGGKGGRGGGDRGRSRSPFGGRGGRGSPPRGGRRSRSRSGGRRRRSPSPRRNRRSPSYRSMSRGRDASRSKSPAPRKRVSRSRDRSDLFFNEVKLFILCETSFTFPQVAAAQRRWEQVQIPVIDEPANPEFAGKQILYLK